MNSRAILFFISIFATINVFCADLQDLRPILDSQKNQAVINIPKGNYFLDVEKGAHYSFKGMKNVVVQGNGSTVICRKQSRAFDINNCENFSLQNITIDYDPLCFTQGTISSISEDGKKWEVTLHDGYPTQDIYYSKIQLFDPVTNDLKQNFYTLHNSDYEFVQSTVDARKLTLTIKRNITKGLVKAGEYIVFPILPKGVLQHCICIEKCKNLLLKNVTVYGSNMFSIVEHDCDNSNFLNCTITRNPNDPTKSVPRLRSGNGDGIHSKHAVKGPTIEGCRVEYNADDNIAINGRFYPVYKVDKEKGCIYVLSGDNGEVRLGVNDQMVIVDNNGPQRGTVSVSELSKVTPAVDEIKNCFGQFTVKLSNASGMKFGIRVKLKNWMEGINVGDLVYSKNRTGSNFVVKNNIVGHTRARGILIKASDGVIANNTIEGTQLSAIVLAPEFNWMEAGCPSNVEVKNNKIKGCLHAFSHPGMVQPGAITVITLNGKGEISAAGASSNISIHDNEIDSCPKPYIVATSTTNLSIFNNKYSNEGVITRKHGEKFGIDFTKNVWVKNVVEYKFTQNK